MRRSTKRERVFRVLEEAAGPLSACEVLVSLGAGVSQATVYRTLREGIECGRLVPVELESGRVRYEPAGLDHHHHFVCSDCERAFDVEACAPDVAHLVPAGFEVTGHAIVFSGACSDCGGAA